jgi:hypothetical protein
MLSMSSRKPSRCLVTAFTATRKKVKRCTIIIAPPRCGGVPGAGGRRHRNHHHRGKKNNTVSRTKATKSGEEEERRENEETFKEKTRTKPPRHFDGRNFRKKREEVDDYKLVTEEEKTRLREKFINHLWLAPLTKGGNLPFRRLCATFEAKVLVSEMSYARFLNRGNPVEKTHLRRHDSEEIFGAQIATNIIEEGVRSARMAYEFNADFVDLNCGCPTHEVTKRGLGARLLRKPA